MRNLAAVLILLCVAGCFQSGGSHEPSPQAVELNNQAVRALRQGDLDRALLLVNDAISQDPRFYGAYSNKAAILEKQGKLAEAADVLAALIKIRPDHAEASVARGVLLEKTGKKDDAQAQYAEALKLYTDRAQRADPAEKPGFEVGKAVTQYLLNDRAAALATLEAVLEANPDLETARVYKQRIESGRRDVFLNGPEQPEQEEPSTR